MNPSAGTVTMPPIRAPRPSVEASRNLERGNRSSETDSGMPASPTFAGSAGPVGLSGGASAVCTSGVPAVRSRTHRNANTSATIAPRAAIHQETIRPIMRTTTPTAKPTGQRLGPGTCGWSSFGGKSLSWNSSYLVDAGSTPYQAARVLTDSTVCRPGNRFDPVLLPPAVDERAHLVAHRDLGRPLPRAFERPLCRRVDPDLAADELERRRVVEVVERPLADHDVPLRVDVGTDVEHDRAVVVHVDVRVDDDDALREAEHPEAPDRVHDLLRVAGERLLDGDDAEVVKRAGDGQVVVDDLR